MNQEAEQDEKVYIDIPKTESAGTVSMDRGPPAQRGSGIHLDIDLALLCTLPSARG